jgi:glycosyltransferase involved in cell wall biosynthesis
MRSPVAGTKTSIVVTNYNYGAFLADALRSALHQKTECSVHVVIIDDGSTDNSLTVINAVIRDESQCTVISKSNGGQLSAFNAAISAVPQDTEIILFLDADDVLAPNCVEQLQVVYRSRPDIDCVFSTPRPFAGPEPDCVVDQTHVTTDVGYTTAAAWIKREWIGAPTSGMSMRATLARKLLPIPLEKDWRIRADDCLVWGASLAGARKVHVGGTLVHYRTHANNSFHGKRWTEPHQRYLYEMAINRLWAHFDKAFGLSRLNADQIYLEFRCHEKRGVAQALRYSRIAMAADLSPLVRLRLVWKIWMRTLYDAMPFLRTLRPR